jgi:hypothetical protein
MKFKAKNSWTILCPGPSLSKVSAADFLDFSTNVVAVNHAILLSHAVADYWVLMDPEVFAYVVKELGTEAMFALAYIKDVFLWLHWNFEEFGKNKDANTQWSEGVLNCYKAMRKEFWRRKDDVADSHGEVIDPYDSSARVLWNEFSMFAAIALAIKNSANDIAIYGADLKDEGYFAPHIPLNWRADHTTRRWARERWFFAQIIRECKVRGIRVHREG